SGCRLGTVRCRSSQPLASVNRLEEVLIERRVPLQLGEDLIAQLSARLHAAIVQHPYSCCVGMADKAAEEPESLRAVQPCRRSGEGTREHRITKAGAVVVQH